MEVSGRTKSNQEDRKENILCQQCHVDGDNVSAEGYCETCNEYFCSSCLEVHRKQSLSKNHVIKSKHEMPRVKIQADPCSELCALHKTEIVKFYCHGHNSVGCGDCMVLEHKSCKVHLVSDVSGNYGDSDELVQIKKKIEDIRKDILASKHEIERSLQVAEEVKIKVIKDIKSYRREMNSYLDHIETYLIQEIEKINVNDVSQQSQFLDECKVLENEISDFQEKLENCTDKINELFVTAKLARMKIKKLQSDFGKVASRSQIHLCKFEPCKDLELLKQNQAKLGIIATQTQKFTARIKKSVVDMKTHYVKKLDVKTTDDKCTCWITGLAMLSPDELLLVDYNNSSLKILNVRDDTITTRYKTPGKPWDVTVINSEIVAITLRVKGKILFISTKNGLSDSHSLEVREGCAGIDHLNGVIAVSFTEPPAVQILNMKGDILHEVKDTSMFKYPQYIAFRGDKSIVVSDLHKHAVYELTVDGHLKAIMTSENLKSPGGLAVTSNGTVVVCGQNNSGSLSMIVPDTREILPLFIQHVQKPRTILICEESNKMFLCENYTADDRNHIKMFDLR
ncbi:E3 ubiquitin-protein ligase TRIM71-like [Mercenaria mercenaria]|uniref:E3 ubiquitin-protein ligase TRIM71-like n=1 Tax=Mercenaria mercenaria TaxID=6596 RepID=UPI00234EAF37|nr:E3 ubiquitin-protein ligase TRIM71-like [Mercenaria mercenaria]